MTATAQAGTRRWWWLWLLLLLAALAGGLWKWQASRSAAPGEAARPERAIPVRLTSVYRGDFALRLQAPATVVAWQTAEVRPRVGGVLTRLHLREGQPVQAGELLAEIDPRPYQAALDQAEGQLQEAAARLREAEQVLARYQKMHAGKALSLQDLQAQQALVEQYRGALRSQQGERDQARLDLEFTRIRAPIAGRAGLRGLDVGNLLTANDSTVLVTITQMQPIALEFSLPQADLPALLRAQQAGQPLAVQALDASDQPLAAGVVDSLDNRIDTATGTLKIRARFENTDGLLFPNQFVNASLLLETRQNVTLLPADAIQVGSRGSFVWKVLEEAGQLKVSLQPVEVIASDGKLSQLGSGVEPGERVVLEGIDRLREGSKVSEAAQASTKAAQ